MSDVHVRVHIGAESYSLPIASVREIAELGDIAPLPGAPAGVLGVCNMHGRVLPVIGLAGMLGIGHADHPTRIVIAEDGGRVAGLAVDSVSGVELLSASSEDVDSPHVNGSVLVDGVLVGTIDVGAVFESIERGSAR